MKIQGLSRAAIAVGATIFLALALASLASALSFQETSQSPLPDMTHAAAVATGNFNDDGYSDLAVADGAGVVIWLSNGDGTFTVGLTKKAKAGKKLELEVGAAAGGETLATGSRKVKVK
jgi:hypothetical protein